jgi:hypothetical protein
LVNGVVVTRGEPRVIVNGDLSDIVAPILEGLING